MATVTLKLFALLQKHLPPGSRGSKATVEVEDGSTAGALLEPLGVARSSVHLITVNGEQAGWDTPLSDGDTVVVFPPVAGG